MVRSNKNLSSKNSLSKQGILIVILIILSGTNVGITYYYKQLLYFFFGVCFCIFLLHLHDYKTINYAEIALIVFCILSMLINGREISSYMAIIIQLIIAYILARYIDYIIFTSLYIEIMYFLCISSIVFYLVGLFVPSFPLLFPVKYMEGGQLRTYNAFLYEYKISIYTNAVEVRNGGIFWEPGCFQFFINLAIFFSIQCKKSIKYLIIFSITVLTTVSTTGIIILFILISYIIFWKKTISNYKKILLIIILCFLIILFISIFGSLINQKIDNFFDIKKTLSRLDFNRSGVFQQENLIDFLFGLSFKTEKGSTLDAANSFVYYWKTMGALFVLSLIVLIIHDSFKLQSVVFLIVITFSCFSEGLLVRPFMLTLLFLIEYTPMRLLQNRKSLVFSPDSNALKLKSPRTNRIA